MVSGDKSVEFSSLADTQKGLQERFLEEWRNCEGLYCEATLNTIEITLYVRPALADDDDGCVSTAIELSGLEIADVITLFRTIREFRNRLADRRLYKWSLEEHPPRYICSCA